MTESKWGRVLRIAALCLGFDVFVQCALVTLHLAPRLTVAELAVLGLRFPFLFLEHALVALAIGGLWLLTAGRRPLVAVYVASVTAVHAWLLVDLAAYPLFFRRFHVGMLEASVVDALRLATARPRWLIAGQEGVVVAACGALAVFALLLIREVARKPSATRERPGPSRASSVGALGYTAIGYTALALLVARAGDNADLDRHPLRVLIGAGLARPTATAAGEQRPFVVPSLLYGNESATNSVAPVSLRSDGRRPHIVLVVLESVGTKQLFVDGVPDSGRAPFLSRLARSAVVFDSVYVSFPGTARSHVSMITGGPTPTTSNVWRRLPQPYRGPTMISAVREQGYETALFSAGGLTFQALDQFYANLGFDTFRHHEDDTELFEPDDETSPWGASEQALRRVAVRWIDESWSRRDPFFLALHTVSTHYPYSSPADGRDNVELSKTRPPGSARPSAEERQRYNEALRYTDRALGDFFGDLERRGLAEDTVFVITGDHGQAFGGLHRFNVGHMGRLYDENIRSFAIVAAPGRVEGPLRRSQPVANADLAATVAALAGAPPRRLPGRDLLSSGRAPRLVFFHLLNPDPACGLRDGQWKYFGHLTGDKARLFDLARDPDEQSDLAQQRADQVETYRRLCRRWVAAVDRSFVEHLQGEPAPDALHFADRPSGPQELFFAGRPQGQPLFRAKRFREQTRVLVIAHFSPYPHDLALTLRVVAPDGSERVFDRILPANRIEVQLDLGPVRTTGRWAVRVEAEGESLLEGEFEVLSAPA